MPTHKHNPANGPEIVLKPGTIRVEIQEVPQRIAKALYPPDACNGPATVTHLTKVVNGNPFGERPTAKELDALNRTVWANLPPYIDGITAEEWARYNAAFRAAKDRPAWELMPTILNPGYNGDGGAMMRAQAEAEHEVLLGKALVEGRITAITHAGAPVLTPFLGHGVYISVRELERYLAHLALPIALRIGEPEAQELVQAQAQPARADALGQLFDEAIENIAEQGQQVTAQAVFHWLRSKAEAKRPPFTGVVTASRLHWRTSTGTNRQLTVDAVRDRLRRRKKAESTRNRTR